MVKRTLRATNFSETTFCDPPLAERLLGYINHCKPKKGTYEAKLAVIDIEIKNQSKKFYETCYEHYNV